MFAAQIARAAAATVGYRFAPTVARCDAAVDDGGFEEGTFAGGASSSEPEATQRFRPPMIYENLAGTLRQGSVNNYDGFRVAVQKQVNLNTVVSHFYWVGSQAAPPIYQYRIILPFEDGKTINAATDMDFNIECELRAPLGRGANAKTNFSMHDQQGNTVSFDVDVTDESSATQFVYSPTAGSLAMSYMQSIGKSLLLGGEGQYTIKDNSVKMSFGATYDDKENLLAAQWDTSLRLLFLKRVNPNRVHLSADLVVDAENTSTMTVGAEYMFKQSKLHMSLDSNLLLKSYLEANIGPGFSLQICGEMMQAKEHYKFGMGLQML